MGTAKKSSGKKAPVTISSPLDMQIHGIDPSPYLAMQVKEKVVLPETERAMDTDIDTDLHDRVQAEIEEKYPRTRFGVEGLLDAILRELVRARLSR